MKAAAPQNGASAAIRPYQLFSMGAAAPPARLAAPSFLLGSKGRLAERSHFCGEAAIDLVRS